MCLAFTIELTVWVQCKGDLRPTWVACRQLGPHLGRELVRTVDEIAAVLRAQGRLVARLLAGIGTPYPRFRIHARSVETGALVGLTHWQMSGGAMAEADGYPWAALAA